MFCQKLDFLTSSKGPLKLLNVFFIAWYGFVFISKAYDCLPHDLMVAKVEVYGLVKESLQLIIVILSFCLNI